MYLDRMTGLIMLGAGGGGGSAGGGSCKFYECASVDDGGSWSGYEWILVTKEVETEPVVNSYILTATSDWGGNGEYVKSTEMSDGCPVYVNGDYKLFRIATSDTTHSWCVHTTIVTSPGSADASEAHNEDTPPASLGGGWCTVTPVTSEQEPIYVQMYEKSSVITSNLTWTSVKPKVGKSYSEDALAEILKFYQGFTIPEEGLIFACLMDDAGKTATGQSITNNGGAFGEHEGVPAVYFNGNSNLSIYSYDMDTVMGSNPSTMSCWLYFPEAQAMQEHPYYAFTYGNRSGGGQSRCIGVYGDGSVKADTWGGTTSGNILGGWHHVAAIFASNTVKLYIDGELSSYGSCDLYTQSPWIYIGSTSSSDPQFIGYVGPCRIYNRELEEDEIMGLYKEYAGK